MGIAIWMITGCATLEPGVYDPALEDVQLTMQVLKSHNREAQQMILDLRAELAASQKALAASQVARAKLEGQLREVERRYDEARHVIDLQREELVHSRNEREAVLRASRDIKRQLSRLQRQLAALPALREGRPSAVQDAAGGQQVVVPHPDGPVIPGFAAKAASFADGRPGHEASRNGVGYSGMLQDESEDLDIVIVQPGDTLWSIARRYHVSFPALRSLNGLDENPDLIFEGQELLLPPSR